MSEFAREIIEEVCHMTSQLPKDPEGVQETMDAAERAVDALLQRRAPDPEKERRVHWQGLAYVGMRVIDAILLLPVGKGTTEETMKADAERALIALACMKKEGKHE